MTQDLTVTVPKTKKTSYRKRASKEPAEYKGRCAVVGLTTKDVPAKLNKAKVVNEGSLDELKPGMVVSFRSKGKQKSIPKNLRNPQSQSLAVKDIKAKQDIKPKQNIKPGQDLTPNKANEEFLMPSLGDEVQDYDPKRDEEHLEPLAAFGSKGPQASNTPNTSLDSSKFMYVGASSMSHSAQNDIHESNLGGKNKDGVDDIDEGIDEGIGLDKVRDSAKPHAQGKSKSSAEIKITTKPQTQTKLSTRTKAQEKANANPNPYAKTTSQAKKTASRSKKQASLARQDNQVLGIRASQKQERRKRILAVLAKLATTKPENEITIALISKGARMAPGNFYGYFSGIEEALATILDEKLDMKLATLDINKQALKPLLISIDTYLNTLAAAFKEVPFLVARRYLQESCAINSQGFNGLKLYAHGVGYITSLLEHALNNVKTEVKEASESKELQAKESRIAGSKNKEIGELVMSFYLGTMLVWVQSNGLIEPEPALESFKENVLKVILNKS